MTATTPTTETGIVELLPCPFCGETETDVVEWVECRGCGAFGPTGNKFSKQSAAERWNTRAAMPDSTQLLQTMAGAAERVLSWWPEPSEATSRSGQAKGDAFADDIHALRDVLAQFRAQGQRS